MRIGLLPLEIGRKVGGLEVYETNLIRALARVDSENEYRVFCMDPAVSNLLEIRASNVHFEIIPTSRVKGLLWDVPRALAKSRLDLFHALFVPPPFTSVPCVFTHHGSEVMERPDFYPFALGARIRFLYRRAFRKAARIICVSNYVRDYLARVRGISNQRLATVYHGVDPAFATVRKEDACRLVAKKYGLTKPYLLTVGRIEPRKNPVRVLQAYARFLRSVSDAPKLVFVGMKTWSARDFDRTVAELNLHDAIIEAGYVPSHDLPLLYAASEFAIYVLVGGVWSAGSRGVRRRGSAYHIAHNQPARGKRRRCAAGGPLLYRRHRERDDFPPCGSGLAGKSEPQGARACSVIHLGSNRARDDQSLRISCGNARARYLER